MVKTTYHKLYMKENTLKFGGTQKKREPLHCILKAKYKIKVIYTCIMSEFPPYP